MRGSNIPLSTNEIERLAVIKEVKRKSSKKDTKGRRKRQRKMSLADVEYLRRNTNFNEKDIKEWFRIFLLECPLGVLSKDKVSSPRSNINRMLYTCLHCRPYKCVLSTYIHYV